MAFSDLFVCPGKATISFSALDSQTGSRSLEDTRLSSPPVGPRARIVPPIVLMVTLDNVNPDPGRPCSQNDRWAIFWLKEELQDSALECPAYSKTVRTAEVSQKSDEGIESSWTSIFRV